MLPIGKVGKKQSSGYEPIGFTRNPRCITQMTIDLNQFMIDLNQFIMDPNKLTLSLTSLVIIDLNQFIIHLARDFLLTDLNSLKIHRS